MKRAALGLFGLSMMSPAFAQIAPPDTVRISSNFSITQTVKDGDTAAIDNCGRDWAQNHLSARRAGMQTTPRDAGEYMHA
ncbi:MAG: hypothetical protein WDN02_17450 [Methylovirgula sp.]|uniref:hypothetical protein n=1 Tax=Methylovirgula sp. TaxID=1978224 RepID=UPI00307645E3